MACNTMPAPFVHEFIYFYFNFRVRVFDLKPIASLPKSHTQLTGQIKYVFYQVFRSHFYCVIPKAASGYGLVNNELKKLHQICVFWMRPKGQGHRQRIKECVLVLNVFFHGLSNVCFLILYDVFLNEIFACTLHIRLFRIIFKLIPKIHT